MLGLINDPEIDGTYEINRGLRIARSLLAEVTDMGLSVGGELLDTISPQFLSDCLSYGAIGARTVGQSSSAVFSPTSLLTDSKVSLLQSPSFTGNWLLDARLPLVGLHDVLLCFVTRTNTVDLSQE